MAKWNESEFAKQAAVLAEQHVKTKKSIADLAEKTAREEALGVDEIRTLVRMTNVATFQALFKEKTGSDKMIEYQVGDAEDVIRRIHDDPHPAQTANVNNDKLASYEEYEVPDQMRVKRYGAAAVAEAEKVASEEPAAERKPRLDMEVLKHRQLRDEFEIEKTAQSYRWDDSLLRLTKHFRRAQGYGQDFDGFEKDAYAEFGLTAEPEIVAIREILRKPVVRFSTEKVAEFRQHHFAVTSEALDLLREAVKARENYEKIAHALEYLDKNAPKIEG